MTLRHSARHLALSLTLSLLTSAPGCGGPSPTDAGTIDAGAPVDATSPTDAAAQTDAGAPEDASVSMDAGEAPDASAPMDAGAPMDGGIDAGTPDAGFPLPASCADTSECGPDATCVGDRCVCSGGSLPCGASCCVYTYARDVTLAASGHAPEIGSDADGNVFVPYKVGSNPVRLATLLAGSMTPTTEAIATSSGRQDDADLAVAPDGTVHIAVHEPASGRSGVLVLYSRARGASSFDRLALVPPAADVFAFDAAVSISRAPGGDLYAGASARSGDGTTGLSMARYVETDGVWVGLPTVLRASAYSRSELFARDDGFFLGVFDFPNTRTYFQDFDTSGTALTYIAGASGSSWGQAAAAMSAAGALYTFTAIGSSGGAMASSDGALDEAITFAGMTGGSRSDIDMALDADENPVLFLHSVTHHAISVMVRMPAGGYTLLTWYEASFLPPATTSSWMTLDAERLVGGNLAFAIGDSMDRGPLQLRELER